MSEIDGRKSQPSILSIVFRWRPVAQSHATLLYVITLFSSVIVWTNCSFKSSERQERSSGGRNSEHMSHHGGLDSVLTPFGAHTHVVEDEGRKLRLQMMTGPFGGAAGTGFLREECWMDGWRSGAKDGRMDRTSGQESARSRCVRRIGASQGNRVKTQNKSIK